MAPAGPQGLEVASLWRRFAAVVVDFVVLGVPMLGAIFGAGALYVRHLMREGRGPDSMPEFKWSPRWKAAIWVVSGVADMATRNRRSFGYRALGLRRVDARTGGPVSVRSALMKSAAGAVFGQLTERAARPWRARGQRRVRDAQAEIERAKAAHADNPEALQAALMDIYKRHQISPVGSCAPPLVSLAVLQAPAIWSPLNQTISDRVSRTVVVRE